MRIYVAGRTTEFRKVRGVQDIVASYGHTISHDWTNARSDDEWRAGELMDGDPREYAEADRDGVATCSLVVVVCGEGMVGTLIEVGMALAWNRAVWLFGELERDSVFFYLAGVKRVPTYRALHNALAEVGSPGRTMGY